MLPKKKSWRWWGELLASRASPVPTRGRRRARNVPETPIPISALETGATFHPKRMTLQACNKLKKTTKGLRQSPLLQVKGGDWKRGNSWLPVCLVASHLNCHHNGQMAVNSLSAWLGSQILGLLARLSNTRRFSSGWGCGVRGLRVVARPAGRSPSAPITGHGLDLFLASALPKLPMSRDRFPCRTRFVGTEWDGWPEKSVPGAESVSASRLEHEGFSRGGEEMKTEHRLASRRTKRARCVCTHIHQYRRCIAIIHCPEDERCTAVAAGAA